MDDFPSLDGMPAGVDDIERFKTDVASGVEKMRTLAYGDLEEIRAGLDAGDIQAAIKAHAEMHGKLSALGFAEHQFAALGQGEIVPVANLQEGMRVRDLGRVTATSEPYDEPCASGRHSHRLVDLTFEDEEQATTMLADARVVVIAGGDTASDPA